MSELKAYIAPTPDGTGLADYYLKSEADKVIADLEESHKMEVEQLLMEIVELKKQVHDYARGLYVIQAKAGKELRHHKYKRCLAMADMCSEALCYWDNVKYTFFKGEAYCFRKMNHYGKWGQIWLAIAEKFRELK